MAQGVVKVYDPTTGVGVIVNDSDRSEVMLRPGSLQGSVFHPPPGPAHRVSGRSSDGQNFAHSIGFGSDGLLEAVSGQRSAVSGQRSRSAVQRSRSAVSGQRSAVSGRRSAVSGRRSAVSGQRSAVSSRLLTALRFLLLRQ
jgi:hypothetical protein